MKNKIGRDTYNSYIFGVCAGLSDYFNVDVILIRLIFLFGHFFISSNFLLVYLLLAIAMPEQKHKGE